MHQIGELSGLSSPSRTDVGLPRDTLFAARMARELLWEEERTINLDEFVIISQTYVILSSASYVY